MDLLHPFILPKGSFLSPRMQQPCYYEVNPLTDVEWMFHTRINKRDDLFNSSMTLVTVGLTMQTNFVIDDSWCQGLLDLANGRKLDILRITLSITLTLKRSWLNEKRCCGIMICGQ